jgi:WD40 repeat protein
VSSRLRRTHQVHLRSACGGLQALHRYHIHPFLGFVEPSSLAASWDKTVKSWDVKTGCLTNTFLGHEVHPSVALPCLPAVLTTLLRQAAVRCMCVYGNVVFTGSADKNIMAWNASTGRSFLLLTGHKNMVREKHTTL